MFPHIRSDIISPAFPQLINLSCNAAFRSLEIVRGSDAFPFPQCAHTIKGLLSTIKSPTFSEIVVVLFERDVLSSRWLPPALLREMYDIKGFRLAFCLEASEESRVQHFPQLVSKVEAEAARGTFDFLSCPPAVFSRTVTSYDCSASSEG